eukprot:363885-Chlamydomonas_euryale.AAC.11
MHLCQRVGQERYATAPCNGWAKHAMQQHQHWLGQASNLLHGCRADCQPPPLLVLPGGRGGPGGRMPSGGPGGLGAAGNAPRAPGAPAP